MIGSVLSGCMNHPGIEAVARCKQCGRPVCRKCVVESADGHFCSDVCHEKYAKFVDSAKKLEAAQPAYRPSIGERAQGLVVRLVILLVVAAVAAVVITYFGWYDIPVVGSLIRPYLP